MTKRIRIECIDCGRVVELPLPTLRQHELAAAIVDALAVAHGPTMHALIATLLLRHFACSLGLNPGTVGTIADVYADALAQRRHPTLRLVN